MLDFGHYPLTPWLNKIKSDEFYQKNEQYTYFMPSKPRDDLIIVRHPECSNEFAIMGEHK